MHYNINIIIIQIASEVHITLSKLQNNTCGQKNLFQKIELFLFRNKIFILLSYIFNGSQNICMIKIEKNVLEI